MTETEEIAGEKLLAETIANHFPGARVVTNEDDEYTVELGEGLPSITCEIKELRDEAPFAAFIQLVIQGGRLGTPGALVTASGYGDQPLAAIVTAGCNWACAFGPVLLTGIDRPDLITTEDPDVEQFETTVGGRRYRVAVSHLDRAINTGAEAAAEWRQRLGGPSALTRRVLASGTIPHSRSGDVLPLGCFAGIGPSPLSEVKFGASDWEAGCRHLEGLGTIEDSYVMLREWALLTPVEAPPALTRQSLQATLDLLRGQLHNPFSEAGWHGGRAHGMRLGDPGRVDGVTLPRDLAWFVDQIAASGAGPGYGLDLHPAEDGWLQLATAGCGDDWGLKLEDGTVWLDSRGSDGELRQVAPSFSAWYEAWLDNAVRGGGPFGGVPYLSHAAINALAQVVEDESVEDLSGLHIALQDEEGEPLGPCHACESTYANFDIPGTAFDPEDNEPTVMDRL